MFKNLFKSGSKKKEITDDQIEAVEEFDIAMEKLEKGKKESEEETETEETSEEEEESEEESEETSEEEVEESETEEKPKKTKKSKADKNTEIEKIEKSESLEKIIGESSEAQAAMDVEPYLKSLVAAIDKKLEAIRSETNKQLSVMNKSFEKMTDFQKAQSDFMLAEGKLLKSALGVDGDSLDEPLERKSVLSERFVKSESGEEELSVIEAKMKLNEFAKSGALDSVQVSKVENRINHNLVLPAFFTEMVRTEKPKKEDK